MKRRDMFKALIAAPLALILPLHSEGELTTTDMVVKVTPEQVAAMKQYGVVDCREWVRAVGGDVHYTKVVFDDLGGGYSAHN